jgi:hypothetical protein
MNMSFNAIFSPKSTFLTKNPPHAFSFHQRIGPIHQVHLVSNESINIVMILFFPPRSVRWGAQVWWRGTTFPHKVRSPASMWGAQVWGWAPHSPHKVRSPTLTWGAKVWGAGHHIPPQSQVACSHKTPWRWSHHFANISVDNPATDPLDLVFV